MLPMKSSAIFALVSLKNSSSKDDDLDLLGDDVEAFSESQADLAGAAENLFSSPPCPQTLRFESLSQHLKLSHPPQVQLYKIR